MCGRFALKTPPADIARRFGLDAAPSWTPRYNIAPSLAIPLVRAARRGGRECVLARWGLTPAWSSQAQASFNTINARAETLAFKPAFKAAFRQRRCLICADGFYEWPHGDASKQPYFISLSSGEPFAFAGLWERWERAGESLESCAIIVTQANALMQPIHARMPVILAPEDYARWLDPSIQDPANLQPLLQPYPADAMQAWRVGAAVNQTRNEGAGLIEAAPAPRQLELF
jgi:putative SOS response-associated peptidase YedK